MKQVPQRKLAPRGNMMLNCATQWRQNDFPRHQFDFKFEFGLYLFQKRDLTDQLGNGTTKGAIAQCAAHTAYNDRVFGLDAKENTVYKVGCIFSGGNDLGHGN